jgi:hypothetical protein
MYNFSTHHHSARKLIKFASTLVLLEASKHAPMPAMARELLETAVQDYEKVMRLQQSYFDKLSMHARGELLLALGSGWHRLGDENIAEPYFKRLAKAGAGTAYAEKAQFWLEKRALPQNLSCTGCHAR